MANAKRPITADTVLRLGLSIAMAPRFWLNLQTEHDMRFAVRKQQAVIPPRICVHAASA